MGYGGNGISYSQVASEVVASAIRVARTATPACSPSSVSKR